MDHSTDVVEQKSSSCSSQHFQDSMIESSSSSFAHHKSILLTSSDHNIIHSKHSPAKVPIPVEKEPELNYLSTLMGALLLTSSLASIAGLDAKIHCQSRQAYEINQLFDDDAVIFSQLQRVQEEHACVVMWRYVMLPVTVVTLGCGSTALYLVRRRLRQQPTTLKSLPSFYNVVSVRRNFVIDMDLWHCRHYAATSQLARGRKSVSKSGSRRQHGTCRRQCQSLLSRVDKYGIGTYH